MNGLTEIKVGGETFPLLFGVKATKYITEALSENFFEDDFEINKALVFGGMMNYYSYIGKPLPHDFPQQVYMLVEAWLQEADAKEQSEHISKVFAESKFGSKLMENLEEAKKKVMKELEEMKASAGMTLEDTV